MKVQQMKDRRYSIKTLFRLNSSKTKFPRFSPFFSFYNSKCPRMLNHRRKNPTDACIKCGYCSSEEWKYSNAGYEFYKLYFGTYDKIMIRKEIQGILNKIVEETFDLLSQDLIRIIKKVESHLQLIEAVTLLYTKALIEPNYMELYASVCTKLSNVNIQDRNKIYNFETELMNLLDDATASFPSNDRDIKKFLRTVEFTGHLYQKKFKVKIFVLVLIDKILKFKDVNFVGEALCKILPSVATKTPKFLAQLDQFSQIKPTTSRIKFLMMDALDSIKKEPYKGDISNTLYSISSKWTTHIISKKNHFKKF